MIAPLFLLRHHIATISLTLTTLIGTCIVMIVGKSVTMVTIRCPQCCHSNSHLTLSKVSVNFYSPYMPRMYLSYSMWIVQELHHHWVRNDIRWFDQNDYAGIHVGSPTLVYGLYILLVFMTLFAIARYFKYFFFEVHTIYVCAKGWGYHLDIITSDL